MEVSQHLLAHIAIIIILAKLFSSISARFKQPAVLGMLLIGMIIGPSGFDLIKTNEVLKVFAEIGVIILLFEAGLETEIEMMRKAGKSSFLSSIFGVIVPFVLGTGLAILFHLPTKEAIVIGIVLTATSVSVTVMTLMDMKKFRTVEGNTIMGAAIIDDVIGILLLTVVFSFFGSRNHSIGKVMLSISVYIIVALIFAYFFLKFIMRIARLSKDNEMELSIGLALALLYSWGAKIVGMASITGSYFSGLFIGMTKSKHRVFEGIRDLGQSLFVPIFFINIGLETNLREVGFDIKFAFLFILIAIVGKIIGGGIGAALSGFNLKRSITIGVGLAPRGEVALVVANMALAEKIISLDVFGVIVLMVVASAMVTPFLLKVSFKGR